MATYPTLGQQVGSYEEWVDDLQIDRAVNGATKARAFFTAKKRRFHLKHTLTTAEVGTLQTFYDSYRTSANSFTWARDGVSYTVLFDGAPTVTPIAAGFADVKVTFVQQ